MKTTMTTLGIGIACGLLALPAAAQTTEDTVGSLIVRTTTDAITAKTRVTVNAVAPDEGLLQWQCDDFGLGLTGAYAVRLAWNKPLAGYRMRGLSFRMIDVGYRFPSEAVGVEEQWAISETLTSATIFEAEVQPFTHLALKNESVLVRIVDKGEALTYTFPLHDLAQALTRLPCSGQVTPKTK
jgi:hypothetical protein